MACVSSLPACYRLRHFSASQHSAVIPRCKNHFAIPCISNKSESETKPSFCVEDKKSQRTKRREVLLKITLASFSYYSLASSVALAENGHAFPLNGTDDFRVYTDEANKFQIMIPQDWLVGTGEGNGFKSVTAFYPEGASNSNVSVAITGIGADFTRLESFGKVDAFAESLVNGLDRSWQRPPGVAAKLIDSRAANGLYYVEYSLQNPGESCRYIYSAIGMASNGWYNRLYTVTGQYLEEESANYRSKIEKSVSSFRFT